MTTVPGVTQIPGRNQYGASSKYGIAIHATANTATARAEANYATRRTDGVSAHFYADGLEVIQSVDLDARAGHAGSRTGNYNAIAVEITGLNAWTRDQWLARVNWDRLGEVLRWVCARYGIAVRHATVEEMRANPLVRAFYSHDDMRRAWGGTDHTDPGPNFPWDRLLDAVKGPAAPPAVPAQEEDEMKLFTLMSKHAGDQYWAVWMTEAGPRHRPLREWESVLAFRTVAGVTGEVVTSTLKAFEDVAGTRA